MDEELERTGARPEDGLGDGAVELLDGGPVA